MHLVDKLQDEAAAAVSVRDVNSLQPTSHPETLV